MSMSKARAGDLRKVRLWLNSVKEQRGDCMMAVTNEYVEVKSECVDDEVKLTARWRTEAIRIIVGKHSGEISVKIIPLSAKVIKLLDED